MSIKFGTDGWRAVVAEDYTFANVRLVTQAVANYLFECGTEGRGLVVGYDTRFASEHFAVAVAEVLAGNGITALVCEAPAPTPTVSYSILDRNAAGAVIITASHNPPIYNGFKYKPEYAGSASPEVIARIEGQLPAAAEPGAIKRMAREEAEAKGLLQHIDASHAYIKQVGNLVDLQTIKEAGLTVVVDAMFGAGAGYYPRLLANGVTKVVEINAERNPYFGGINPEPIKPNLGRLIKVVQQSGSNLGIALDGDSDRVGIVDEQGNFLNQLQVFALLALYLLEVRGWRGGMVKSISTTSMIDKLGQMYNVPVYETPVGFKYIGPKMLQEEVIIGGEESGGFGFRGHIPERDGIVAGLFIMDMMIKLKRSCSGLLDYLREKVGPYYYERVDLHFPQEERQAILQRIDQSAPRSLAGERITEIKRVDGVKYITDQGSWLLIRFSGTEPIMRVYTETHDAELVPAILAEGRRLAGI